MTEIARAGTYGCRLDCEPELGAARAKLAELVAVCGVEYNEETLGKALAREKAALAAAAAVAAVAANGESEEDEAEAEEEMKALAKGKSVRVESPLGDSEIELDEAATKEAAAKRMSAPGQSDDEDTEAPKKTPRKRKPSAPVARVPFPCEVCASHGDVCRSRAPDRRCELCVKRKKACSLSKCLPPFRCRLLLTICFSCQTRRQAGAWPKPSEEARGVAK